VEGGIAEHYSIVTNNGQTNQQHYSTIFVNKITYLRGKEGKASTSIPRAEKATINIPMKQATDEQINLQKKQRTEKELAGRHFIKHANCKNKNCK
jgi:hypothetical protein